MKKHQVIENFCALSGLVREHLSTGPGTISHAADCFCGNNKIIAQNPYLSGDADSFFSYDEKVMEFIQEAVQEKIDRTS